MSTELTTGPVKDVPSTPRPYIPTREVKEYKGQVQTHEGKKLIQFPIEEKCNLSMGKDKTGKDRGKCKQSLIVVRVKNIHFEWDSGGFGGQLMYDEEDQKMFEYCPVHGPFQAIPKSWESR